MLGPPNEEQVPLSVFFAQYHRDARATCGILFHSAVTAEPCTNRINVEMRRHETHDSPSGQVTAKAPYKSRES